MSVVAQPAVAGVSAKPEVTRVLFARIGWMTHYAGPQAGDERPKGGGGYNKKKVGHELFNFYDFAGHLYGFVRAKNSSISLKRIEPASSQIGKLENVLVIFVAGQRIVGWYRGAIVHEGQASFPPAVKREIEYRLKAARVKNFKLKGYCLETLVKDATLLPTHERTYEVPGHVKGGFGQSNVCYLYRNSGKRKKAPWMDHAIKYVLSYSKDNLLANPEAEASSEDAAVIAQEQRAGFQSNPEIRRAVEDHAMLVAKKALVARGYRSFVNTSRYRPYDYTCVKAGTTFYVEVKGNQALVKSVILTRNEVEHVRANPDSSILVLVQGVKVSGKSPVAASGGKPEIRQRWQLLAEDLAAIQFVWKVK